MQITRAMENFKVKVKVKLEVAATHFKTKHIH